MWSVDFEMTFKWDVNGTEEPAWLRSVDVGGGKEDTREGNSKCKGLEVGMSQWSLSS